MARHEILTPEAHRTLRIKTQRSAALGDGVMLCLTFPDEFRRLQNEYPIVFQLNAERTEFRAAVLFGFERDENLYLKGETWDARYVPLSLDVQPFLIGRTREPGREQVHIDMGSARIGQSDGVRLFGDDGKPTSFLDGVAEKLGALHAGFQGAPDFFAALQRYELIEPFVFEALLADGAKRRLVGFHTINEEKLRALDAAALGDLQERGFLLPIFMQVASLSNLAKLMDRKNANV
ncbi:MAG TPA: SapC family protein [Caulobacterales bacterium]|nr:SapC family protein [Caulobacterales bacterium]